MHKPARQPEKPHSEPNKPGKDQYKRHVDGDITVRGQIETHFPPEYAHKQDAQRKEDKASHRKLYLVNVLTLIAVSIYAGLTLWQVLLTRELIDNTQENFSKENAPVIWAMPDSPIFEVDKPLTWNVRYTNYGRSAALNVQTCANAAYGPKGFAAWEDIKFPTQEQCIKEHPIRSSGVSPPNAPDYVSVVGPKALTAPDVAIINMTDAGAMVVGVITYDDVAGHSYETSFCYYRLQTGAIMHCEKYNYVKRVK